MAMGWIWLQWLLWLLLLLFSMARRRSERWFPLSPSSHRVVVVANNIIDTVVDSQLSLTLGIRTYSPRMTARRNLLHHRVEEEVRGGRLLLVFVEEEEVKEQQQ
jgi:hypothetical protein